jgi:hypothetical protein
MSPVAGRPLCIIRSVERWNVVSPLLDEALALPAQQRLAWLAALRDRNRAMSEELARLLAEADALEREGYLEQGPSLPGEWAGTPEGRTFGAYTIDRKLGHGGMGTAWLAHRSDGRFQGEVAITHRLDRSRQPVLPGAGHERTRLRDVPHARRRLVGDADVDSSALRSDPRYRSDLSHERRVRFAECRRLDPRGASRGLPDAAAQGAASRRHRHPGQRGVRARRSLFTTQVYDKAAGDLTAKRAQGSPVYLSQTGFHFGINDVVYGDYATGAPFDPNVFTVFASWRGERNDARAAVARGEALFNGKPIIITGVSGLNDELQAPAISGTCSTCHDTPNAGSHSVPAPLDIGVSEASRRTPDVPLYTLRHTAAPFEMVQTTDPGRALITGRWKDIDRFKGPTLRGLAARPPYFHNGSAADLAAVVGFYDERFGIGFSEREKQDLVAFLRAL